MSLLAYVRKGIWLRKVRFFKKAYDIASSSVLLPGFSISDSSGDNRRLHVGNHCVLACQMVFETSDHGAIKVGDRCHIGGGTMLISYAGITLGDDVTIAWNCTIYDHDSHSLSWDFRKNDTLQEIADFKATGNAIAYKDWSQVASCPIVIEDRVWIGLGVTVLKGVRIGEGAVIGAGSVVTRDIPPYCVAAGNPARVVKTLNKPKDRL